MGFGIPYTVRSPRTLEVHIYVYMYGCRDIRSFTTAYCAVETPVMQETLMICFLLSTLKNFHFVFFYLSCQIIILNTIKDCAAWWSIKKVNITDISLCKVCYTFINLFILSIVVSWCNLLKLYLDGAIKLSMSLI